VCPDALVGLCLQRGPAMVVAMLAIVKAGGAYLPLDPDYPQERLRFMIEDAAASLVLVEHSLRDRVPASAPVLCIDSPEPDEYPDVDPCAVARPDDLAYVIYTSGSTGTPKGVAVPQRGVIRLVLETDYVRIDARDTIAQASNSSFDAATFEIWGALLAGARLAIVGKERLLSGSALEQEIDRHGITTMFMTTALFNEHAARTPALFSRLATLLVGGEAIDAATVQRVLDAGPPRRLINAYGPTETTTFATWYEIPRHRVAPPIPIGRPISNTRCHILDALMQPVPVGVIGDLYVGGPGLARGYLNRDALTAERFVADPFEAGERLYRTGDRARYRADGQIVYCGRSDQQVKLRGFRIELGEIEDALAQQAGVRQCCIVVREDEPNNRRLVAYVVAESGATITGEFLRTLLAQRLPSYMVPSAVVLMQALPLTANGKLDRDALPRPPAPGSGGPESGMDELERQLSQLWAGVLGVASVGVDDSFFDLGGHSLLAIRLLDAVDKCWGRTLGLASLFEAPTVRAQAALLRSDAPRAGSVSSCAVAVQPAGHRPPLFFVSGYGGALLPFRALAGALGTDQPLYVLDFNSMADLSEDDAVVTVERIATRMLVDMRRIQPHGPYHLAGFSLGGKIVYEMAQQLHRDGESTRLLALLDCAAPGYPRMRSFPVRALLHIRHALAHDRREALRYIADRVLMLRKYFWRVDRKLFEGDDDAGATAVAREIETRSKAAYDAWRAYVPARYAGHITLIAAGRRAYQPGVIRDDPMMGWPALVAGGVDLATLPCDHVQMLDEPYAPELARLLAKRISPEPLASHMG
jgi:amino acid adenylation domain-containing protein